MALSSASTLCKPASYQGKVKQSCWRWHRTPTRVKPHMTMGLRQAQDTDMAAPDGAHWILHRKSPLSPHRGKTEARRARDSQASPNQKGPGSLSPVHYLRGLVWKPQNKILGELLGRSCACASQSQWREGPGRNGAFTDFPGGPAKPRTRPSHAPSHASFITD